MERSIRWMVRPMIRPKRTRKAHDRGAPAVGGDRQHVEVRVIVEHHALRAGRGPLERGQGVAGLGGRLVVLVLGGLLHLAFEIVARS
jgi:hypothetical protein